MSFNLLIEPWIPVLYLDGRYRRVGIREALTQAGRIRQIAASNPMDNVALLRFLLAVLLTCRHRLSNDDRANLAGGNGIPADWLNSELGTASEPNETFNLLGDGTRFYQDKRLVGELLRAKQQKWDKAREKRRTTTNKTPRPTSMDDSEFRPIGDLLVEFPTETKIAHLRHVRDREYGLCPACCALGIIRCCAFANYAGRGYTSGLNGPAPAYAIAQGETLLQTLLLNRREVVAKRRPPWLCDEPPSLQTIDVLTALAWRPRRLWLGDRDEIRQRCSYCGQSARVIRQLAFTGGWKPPFQSRGKEKKFWDQDPHLILVAKGRDPNADEDIGHNNSDESPTQRKLRARSDAKNTTLGFPRPGRRVMAHAGFWRRVLVAAPFPADVTELLVAGPAASQTGMLYQDAAYLRLTRPLDEGRVERLLDAMDKAVEIMNAALKRSTPNPQRQHPERTAALDALSASLEADLRSDLKQWPMDALSTQALDIDRLRERLGPVVRQAVRATTPGSPLRRREAMARAQSALDAVSPGAAAPPPGTPSGAADGSPTTEQLGTAEPKRSRARKGKGGGS